MVCETGMLWDDLTSLFYIHTGVGIFFLFLFFFQVCDLVGGDRRRIS